MATAASLARQRSLKKEIVRISFENAVANALFNPIAKWGIVLRYGAVPVSKEGHLRQHRFDGSVAPLKEQSRIVQRAQDVHELAETRLKIRFQ